MLNLAGLTNEELIDRFVAASEGEDPGPAAADAVGDIENAEEDMESTEVKKARKILIKYIQRKENGETDDEDDDDVIEQNGGRRRRKSRRGRKTKKSRRGRKSRKTKKSRRGRKSRRTRR
jgi:hypothetical protein